MTVNFWYIELNQITSDQTRHDELLQNEVVTTEMVAEGAAGNLFANGVREGDLVALVQLRAPRAVVRLTELTSKSLKWQRLKHEGLPGPLQAQPGIKRLPEGENGGFNFDVNDLKRDVLVAVQSPTPAPQMYSGKNPTPSNIILYGPPGTGKTYSVKRRALDLIIGEGSYSRSDTDEIDRLWRQFVALGQIVFCTFHQSFSYEDFVEGLRAKTKNGTITYEIENGVFKALAECAAKSFNVSDSTTENHTLGAHANSRNEAAQTFEIIWQALVLKLRSSEIKLPANSEGKEFTYKVDVNGNVVCVPANSRTGHGILVPRSHMYALWTVRHIYGNGLSDLNAQDIRILVALRTESSVSGNQEHLRPLLIHLSEISANIAPNVNTLRQSLQFVLVIDEINRANISRVFGELITLLEPDKRLGAENELRVQLPASKEWFGVPPNLHVIGTMNTADRSIALMDVALRRRFDFEEMMPDSDALRTTLKNKGTPNELIEFTVALFEKLNERLRFLYDREHQIGHAYFMKVKTVEDLRVVMATRVLPLLQEYFFGQWEKVAIVLGFPLNSDGSPKSYAQSTTLSILTARELGEVSVLGFDHTDYVDQVDWKIHDAFHRNGRKRDDDGKWNYSDLAIVQALLQILGGTDQVKSTWENLKQRLNTAPEIPPAAPAVAAPQAVDAQPVAQPAAANPANEGG